MTIKLLLIKFFQTITFKRSQGIIFLTKYSKNCIENQVSLKKIKTIVIPHGVDSKFKTQKERKHKDIKSFNQKYFFKLLYVSTIDKYKHQEKVVQAVKNIVDKYSWPIQLVLIGSSYKPALKNLFKVTKNIKLNENNFKYLGEVPHDKLIDYYKECHAGVFASSCENMPNIIIEKMSAGLPLACSKIGPMKVMLKNKGVFFDPYNTSDIESSLVKLIFNKKLRNEISTFYIKQSMLYSWKKTANQTFQFLNQLCKKNV